MAERSIPQVDEDAVAALEELLEVAVELKKSGVLGWLRALAEMGEKLQELVVSEEPLFRLLGLLQALQGGVSRLEPGEYAQARRNAEETVQCLFKGLTRASPAEAPKPGLLGLMGALRDERVRKGLGLLLSLAAGLGECAIEKERAGTR